MPLYLTSFYLFFATMFGGPDFEDTTKETPYIVVYSVVDLLSSKPEFTNVPDFDLNSAVRGTQPFTQNSNRIDFQKQDPQKLIDLIQTVVYPEEWQTGSASVYYWHGNLIVNAPEKIHTALR